MAEIKEIDLLIALCEAAIEYSALASRLSKAALPSKDEYLIVRCEVGEARIRYDVAQLKLDSYRASKPQSE